MPNAKDATIELRHFGISAFGIRHLSLTRVLLISTYDLGRQPFGLASPAAWLRGAGHLVDCVDLTRTRLSEETVKWAALVAFYLPRRMATRLALAGTDRVPALKVPAQIRSTGVYAPPTDPLYHKHAHQPIH